MEYSLTEFGQRIRPVIMQITEWGSFYKKAMGGGHLEQSNSN
ncbi:winged helix-turn-helix transcriptional regulator [Paenibacillus rhizosphaerae]|nr:winged helix-turn-helix transcriptional regulator [Paenibacillus rhizosphaerae]